MKAGFNKNKKQIKSDAIFAYGLVHYYLRDNAGKKDLGLKYIKQLFIANINKHDPK